MVTEKVLIIDDDDGIRSVIIDFLEEQGYKVVEADNAKIGLEKAVSEKPDLIVLDIGLPDSDGYNLCQKMRKKAALRYTPIIMLTARGLEKDELTGFRSGADDYITKPFKLARLLARIQRSIKRHDRELNANALTHLPGNVVISEEINKRIQKKIPFSVLYFDLNHFKAFNDRYGFVRGDKAIKLTADILTRTLSEWDEKKSFLGHLGGDDFVGIVNTHNIKRLCQTIIRRFDEAIPNVYDVFDQKRGKITAVNRKGRKVDFPLMGLAIAVVTNRHKQLRHPAEISFVASEIKKRVKSEDRSTFLVDRRT
ncbi:hypothetical protein BVX98_05925 [bacterium F11]|nr:hypothetical protein BVX98_05925 [bacterium F11]